MTLFVGNIPQDIKEDDLIKTYPSHKKIDVGCAKKLKRTWYAFVTFHSVEDAIKAFLHTHNADIYSKSLIVRFRRLRGGILPPGEVRHQNPPKKPKQTDATVETLDPDASNKEQESELPANDSPVPVTMSPSSDSDTITQAEDTSEVDTNSIVVKTEYEERCIKHEDRKPHLNSDYESPFAPGPVDAKFIRHKPKVKTEIKTEIKVEKKEVNDETASVSSFNISDVQIKRETLQSFEIKEEPFDDFEEVDFRKYIIVDISICY